MKKIKTVVIIMLCFFLSGCWNYHELNDLAITTSMSFDIKDDTYIVSYMVVSPKKDEANSNESKTSVTIYKGEGKSISSAYTALNKENPKVPYIGHLDIVIISEELAKKGIYDVVDFLMRNPESRKQFYVALSKGTDAKSVLEVLSPLDSFSSITNNQSDIFMAQYSDFVKKLLDDGINPILSGIELDGDIDPKTKIDKIGLFKGDVLVGWANYKQSIGINILNNNTKSALLETSCDDKYAISTLNNIKSEIKASFYKDIPKLNIDIRADGSITQINCNWNLEDENVFRNLEIQFEKELKGIMEDSILLAQKEYNVDIFGYGNYIYKNHYHKWEKLKNRWDDQIFPDLDIAVSTKINLKNTGSSKKSLKENTNEK